MAMGPGIILGSKPENSWVFWWPEGLFDRKWTAIQNLGDSSRF
jgi:hypothetical protein